MRSEQEMFDLALKYAQNDDRIRVVGLNGSRTNLNIPKDEFQDYDIVYVVTDIKSFIGDKHWIDYFGKRIIMQKPEAMSLFPPELGNWFSYLMLFEDGIKMDLMLIPLAELELYLKNDKLTMILLDKDQRIKDKPIPTDIDYHVKKPTKEYFDDCCNEFWFVSTYVAKGLCRDEILFAIDHLNLIARPQLLQMLAWKVGIETDFSLSIGKSYKYLKKYLTSDVWGKLIETYRNSTYEDCWRALLIAHDLFRETALDIAKALKYEYPDYDEKVTCYIKNLFMKYSKTSENNI